MGKQYLFTCQTCKLKSEVCGGDDSGMHFECTTVWCGDCNTLADATTSEQYSTRAVACPSQPCPECEVQSLELWEYGDCPRCRKEMRLDSEKDDLDRWQSYFFCDECNYKTRDGGRPEIEGNDTVQQRVICRNCNDLVFVTSRQPGIWRQYSNWSKYDLQCERCHSKNVNRWVAGQPCPACDGMVRCCPDTIIFFD